MQKETFPPVLRRRHCSDSPILLCHLCLAALSHLQIKYSTNKNIIKQIYRFGGYMRGKQLNNLKKLQRKLCEGTRESSCNIINNNLKYKKADFGEWEPRDGMDRTVKHDKLQNKFDNIQKISTRSTRRQAATKRNNSRADIPILYSLIKQKYILKKTKTNPKCPDIVYTALLSLPTLYVHLQTTPGHTSLEAEKGREETKGLW